MHHAHHREDSVHITWGDGHQSEFPCVWLCEACDCERCGSTETAVRHVRLIDKPKRPAPLNLTHTQTALSVDWGLGHVSRYDALWLRAHCLSASERQRRALQPVLWHADAIELPFMDYANVSGSAEAHLRFLETLRDVGFVVLRDVPKAREKTEEVAALVGKIRWTNYGIFELESKPKPEIVGDMAMPLALHTDEPYRIDPPAITLFHVLAQSDHGGDSTLMDGFYLLEKFKRQHPAEFEVLATVPARFNRTLKEGRAFDNQAPIIKCNAQGQVTGLRLLDRGMAPVDAPADQVISFYDALRELLQWIYAAKGQLTLKLAAGEMLVFNNQRMLHGRKGFDVGQSRRHVRSCNVDLDEFHSRLRVAYRLANREEAWWPLGGGACA